MENISEQISLTEAMADAHIREFPEELKDNGKIWVKAIVKVMKCNCRSNYALAVNDGTGNPDIVKDYGSVAKIVKILGIYPYYYLDNSAMPDLRNKQDIITYLFRSGIPKEPIERLLSIENEKGERKSDEQRKRDKEKVKILVYKSAIKNYITNKDERERANRSYNEFILPAKRENQEGDVRDYVTDKE